MGDVLPSERRLPLRLGGVVVAGVAFEAARRRLPSEIALLLGLTRIGVLLVALGFLILLPFGLWLVLNYLSAVLVVAIIVLMAFKPGG